MEQNAAAEEGHRAKAEDDAFRRGYALGRGSMDDATRELSTEFAAEERKEREASPRNEATEVANRTLTRQDMRRLVDAKRERESCLALDETIGMGADLAEAAGIEPLPEPAVIENADDGADVYWPPANPGRFRDHERHSGARIGSGSRGYFAAAAFRTAWRAAWASSRLHWTRG